MKGPDESLNEAYLAAFENIGGIEALTNFARDNPGLFYTHLSKLLSKVPQTMPEVNIHWALPKHPLEDK